MSETSIGSCDPGEGVSGSSSILECGQQTKSTSLDSLNVLGLAPMARIDALCDDDAMSEVRAASEKRFGGPSDDSWASDASFITVGRKPKRLRSTAATTSVPYVERIPDEIFEVYLISKTDLPKQIGLAKLLQANGIKDILRIKFSGPCKVRIQFNAKEEAEKLLSAVVFNNDDKRVYWANQLNYIYGIIKNVDLDVNEEEFLKNIDSSEDIMSVKRLNRLSSEGRWVKSEAIRLCFKGSCLPPYVYAYGCRFKVNPYSSPVTQCSKCWKFGHLIRFCPSDKIICPKCGGAHANCETTNFKCLNCKGPHMALNKTCPAFLREKKIRGIMSYEGCAYKKALWLYMQESRDQQDAPSSSYRPIKDGLGIGIAGKERAGKSYRDAILTKPVNGNASERVSSQQPIVQKPRSQGSTEVESQQEVRKRKKPKRVPVVNEDEDTTFEQPQYVFTEDRDQRRKKRRSSCFERFIEKMKDILLSNESWQEKFKCVCKFIVEECLEMCKKYFKDFELFKFFFSNVNG